MSSRLRANSLADVPRTLFKYRSIASEEELGWVVDSLRNRNFYFASPRDFNDPYDCAPKFEIPTGDDLRAMAIRVADRAAADQSAEVRQAERARLMRMSRDELRRNIPMVQELANQTGIFSLSEDSTNVLMWSHYADSHRGICLEFDARAVVEEHPTAQPVIYSDRRPVVRIGVDPARQLIDNYLLTKAEDWSYEREWRIFKYNEGAGIRQFPEGCITSVILGSRISDENAASISAAASEAGNIRLLQARLADDSFQLDILPLE